MAEYTGVIQQIDGSNYKLHVGNFIFAIPHGLMVTIARSYAVGDRVLVDYQDGKVKSVVGKGEFDPGGKEHV